MAEALASVGGAAVALLRASAAVTALVPATHVYGGQEPQEVRLPYVVVEDTEGDSDWITEGAALEKHKLKVTVYAPAAAPVPVTVPPTPPPANPADAIADACDDAVKWEDLALAGTTPLWLIRGRRVRTVQKKGAPDAERVFKVELNYNLALERFGQ
jgi:hypothetical protein